MALLVPTFFKAILIVVLIIVASITMIVIITNYSLFLCRNHHQYLTTKSLF